MKNKHAFLIGVYKEPDYLEMLLDSLISDRSNIYVHVNDRNWVEFSHLQNKYKTVVFIHNVSVNWGGSSLMKSIISLIEIALENPDNSYFHFITGQDVLIKSLRELFSFFDNNTKSYLSCKDITKEEENFRFGTFHFFDLFNINYGKKDLKYWIEAISWRIQKFLPIYRKTYPFKIRKGSAWWSLHRDAVNYCYNYIKDRDLISKFRNTFAPDETVFQSILLETTKAYQVVNNNLRYIIWDDSFIGGQKLLVEEDLDDLLDSDCFFARKVDCHNQSSFNLIKLIKARITTV